jgi:hypothetical protein
MLTPMSRPAAARGSQPHRNHLSFPRLAADNARGVGLAAQIRSALMWFMGLGLCVTCGSGCLVTEKIPFEPDPLEPPQILDSRTSMVDIGDHFLIDKTTQAMWTMQVVVREQDPSRELRAHYRVYEPIKQTDPPFEQRVVPTGGVDPELRDLSFTVSSDTLSPGKCHKLELAVSGHFLKDEEEPTMDVSAPAFFKFVDPRYADDRAIAVWYVFEGKDNDTLAPDLAQSCGASTVFLTPPKVLMQ